MRPTASLAQRSSSFTVSTMSSLVVAGFKAQMRSTFLPFNSVVSTWAKPLAQISLEILQHLEVLQDKE